jgi:hypothetical protein
MRNLEPMDHLGTFTQAAAEFRVKPFLCTIVHLRMHGYLGAPNEPMLEELPLMDICKKVDTFIGRIVT